MFTLSVGLKRGALWLLPLGAMVALLTVAPAAQAVSRQQAERSALSALRVNRGDDAVIVFRLPKALREGARISQAGTAGRPRRGRVERSTGVVEAPVPALRGLRLRGERAYFFYADLGPFQTYQHPGQVVLVGRETGRVRMSEKFLWPPLIDGRLPAFMRSAKAYHDRDSWAFYRAWSADAAAQAAENEGPVGLPILDTSPPDNRLRKRVADLLAAEGACAIRYSDTLGDFYDFGAVDRTRAWLGALFTQLEDLNPGFVDARYVVRSGMRPLEFAERVIRRRGCREVLLYLAGGAWARGGSAVAIGVKPTSATTLRGQYVTARQVRSLMRAHRDMTFKVIVDAPYASGFRRLLRPEGNALIVATPGGSHARSFAYLPEVTLPGGRLRQHPGNPYGLLEFTNRALLGLELFLRSESEIDQGAGVQAAEARRSFLAWMIARAFALGEAPANGVPPRVDTPFVPGPPATARNRAPQALPGLVTTAEDTAAAITLRASDPDGDPLTYSILAGPAHGTLTGSGRNRTYTPDPEFNGLDGLVFRVSDGRGGVATAAVGIVVTAAADPPQIETSGGTAAFTEDGAPVAVDPGLSVADDDDTELEGATATMSAPVTGDALLFTDQNGITGSYDAGTGVLTLTGEASLADYQAALRSVTYDHSGDAPPATRTVAFRATDGEGFGPAATRDVDITALNDAPTLTASPGTATFTEGGTAVEVDPAITAADPDSAQLSGATVAITGGFAAGEDALQFTDQNGIGGSYDAGTGVLTLTGTADVATYEAALRSVRYANGSASPSTAARTVSFSVSDGLVSSSAATRGVAITAVNNATVVTTTAGATAYAEGDPATTIDAGLTVTDVDDTQLGGATVRISAGFEAADELVFANQAGITGTYNAGTLTLSGTASLAAYQAALRSVQYRHTGDNPATAKTVEFAAGTSAAASKAITVTRVNDAPQIATSGGNRAYTENDGAVAIDGGVTVADPDSADLTGATVAITSDFQAAQDELGFTNQAGIAGSYDDGTGVLTLSGTASVSAYQTALRSVTYTNASEAPAPATRTVTFRATDSGGATGNAATRGIAITAVNDAPSALADSAATDEDTTSTVAAPGVLANDSDADPGDTKTVVRLNGSATLTGSSSKGASVTINANGSFTYNPGSIFQGLSTGQSDTDTFTYTMQDGAGAQSTATVTITISGVSDAPTATADTFSAAGNTALSVGTVRPANQAGKVVTGSLLDNDTDPDTPASGLAVQPVTNAATSLGGTITIEADGNFTYHPDDGDTGVTDTFTYTVSDGVASSTGTLNLPLAGQVWYVRNNEAAGGDGTSDTPFDSLVEAETASGTGDTVYVFDGDNTSVDLATGYAMEANERLIGEHSGVALGGDALHPGTAGAHPTLTATNEDVVTLAAGVTVDGFNLDPTGTGGGLAGGGSAVTISDVNVTDTGTAGTQPGVELDGTTGTSTVTDLTVSTNATGVRLNNAGTVDFGTTTITTTGARALDATGTDLATSAFGAITVTGSGSGGVAMSGTTGSTTFGDLSLTTTGGTAFALANAGTVSVPAAGTANVSATGGPAVDVTGTSGAALAFDTVSSANSPSDGINLAGLGAGTFSATGGTIAGAPGIAFDVDGGSGAISYSGALSNGSGQTAEITGRSGGAVTLSGAIADTNDAGGGITVSGNTGGSTTFSGASKVLNTGASDAVVMTSSDGHTLTLSGGGLDIDATSGRGLAATGSGTLVVSGAGNTIDATTGRALTVTTTDIGAADATFERIASNGAPNGILLDTTGSAGNLVVTGNGGTCTAANTSGCSGGEIRNAVGADDSGSTPAGTGIVLKDTAAPSLTRVWIHDHPNYGIRGTNVAGFTLANSVVNGSNGTNATTPFDDSSVWFTNLTGSASVTSTAVSGGLEDNFRVNNAAGSLNRITFSSVAMGLNSVADGNDSISLQTQPTAGQLHATVENSTFTGTRGDQIDYQHNGTGTGDLDLTSNTFTNSHPGIATGGGGLTLSNNGTSGNTTMDITGNSFRDAVGPAVLVVKTIGPATQTGTFANNTIGVAGVANSGSSEGSGLKLQSVDQGSINWAVTNNQIRGYNNFGIDVTAGGGSTPQSGTLNTTITGNTIAEPGNSPGTVGLTKFGVHLNIGTVPGDTFQACSVLTGNNLATAGSDDDSGTTNDIDVRLRQRQSTTIRLPGYAGSATDATAVQNFVAANNQAGTVVSAAINSPPGGGFTGTGTTCP